MFFRFDQGPKNNEINDKISHFNNNIIRGMGHHYIDTTKNAKGQQIYTKKLLHLDLHGSYELSKACERALHSEGQVTHVFQTPVPDPAEFVPEEHWDAPPSLEQRRDYQPPRRKRWNHGPPPRLSNSHGASTGAGATSDNNNMNNYPPRDTYYVPCPTMPNDVPLGRVVGTSGTHGMSSGTVNSVGPGFGMTYGSMAAPMPNTVNQMFSAPGIANMFGVACNNGGLDPRWMSHAYMN